MRKLTFFSFLLVGAGFGYLWGPPDDWLTRSLMMGISMIFAGAIGGAVAGIGRGEIESDTHDWYEIHRPTGSGIHSKDYATNYWRDEEHAPSTNPRDFESHSADRTHIPHRW